MDRKFRLLTADEIECRVALAKENGVSLLLYKDARCDMNILDETVGPDNWQRSHLRDNANCVVSIWDNEKGQWISKEDTGKESNTEAEKGLASDSFKRACVNWGIGRELYTAPFIWVSSDNCLIYEKKDKNNKISYATRDSFVVDGIEYEDDKISYLSIKNCSSKKIVFTWGHMKSGSGITNNEKKSISLGADRTETYLTNLKKEIERTGVEVSQILQMFKLNSLEELAKNEEFYNKAMNKFKITANKVGAA